MKVNHNMTYNELKKTMKDISGEKLEDLTDSDIYKYLIIKEELWWVDSNYSPDTFTFDESEIENMTDAFERHVWDYFNNDLFYYNDIHSEICEESEEEEDDI